VTIPGKGGRPRKWRSDADRSRAYRARQRGEVEPAEIQQALDDGDALAEARQVVAQLSRQLAENRLDVRVLRAIVQRRDRELVLLDERLFTVRNAIERLRDERAELQHERDHLRAELNRLAQGVTSRPGPPPPGLPRHVRRQLEREQRRRPGT